MNEKYDLTLNTKNIRKVAFAVGLGFTLGKMTGKIVDSALDGAVQGAVKFMASKGNKIAQNVCRENGIRYVEETKHEEPEKIKMGFHV